VSENDERLSREISLCNAYRTCFKSESGDHVLADLKKYCGVDSVCFSQDARQEAFLLGARSVILYVLEKMENRSVDRLRQMMNSKTDVLSEFTPGQEPDKQ